MIKEVDLLNKDAIKECTEEINYNIKNREEAILEFFTESITIHVPLNKECKLIGIYDCDSEDLIDIEFNNLRSIHISGFSLDNTKKIIKDFDENNKLIYISFYQKDNTSISIEFSDEKVFN